jgi:carbon starvation protein
MRKAVSVIVWLSVALLGGCAYFVVAFQRDEPINAGWILAAALCTYAIGYRFYSKWIAAKILTLNDRRATPCEVHEDGKDFVKTNKWIVFGHHFAAISGPGPLVGPVLAAQFGYLPGTLWILIGVVLGGAVQDFMILFCSIRRDGKSLAEMVKDELGSKAGVIALVAIVSIMIILIAALGYIVVMALAESPWGTFTIAATIPIALFMGCYLRFLRVGKVFEITAIGVALLLLAVWGGKLVHENEAWAKAFTLTGPQLAWCIIAYGVAASALPVWLLLAPRDYLSTFMKLGTIGALALGIFFVLPTMQMPPISKFVDGTGPIVPGSVFPFCFITIACGAISGFHSLIASGITPKIITREGYARPVGYGSMLLESAVAIMAMIAACTLQPGIYFSINTSFDKFERNPTKVVQKVSSDWNFPVTEKDMTDLAKDVGEANMYGRVGGAPTLAVGMANIFSQVIGGKQFMGFWYHFALMFEALFILTTVDAGTRVGRFLIQAFLGHIWKPLGDIKSHGANIFASVLLVSAWGYFMYAGVKDNLGGIRTLWPLFGIANQLLAVVALCLATTIIIKMGKGRLMWVTLLPLVWLLTVTFTAGIEKIFDANPSIGFIAESELHFKTLADATTEGAKSVAAKKASNALVNTAVAGSFLVLVAAIVLISAWRWFNLLRGNRPMDLKETEPVWLPESALAPRRASTWAGWLLGAIAIFFGLARQLTGTPVPEKPTQHVACSAKAQDGKEWAEHQEKRFRSPRCC